MYFKKMKPETLVNLIDIAAFLLVTTDLYGRERIATVSSRIASIQAKIRRIIEAPLTRTEAARPLPGRERERFRRLIAHAVATLIAIAFWALLYWGASWLSALAGTEGKAATVLVWLAAAARIILLWAVILVVLAVIVQTLGAVLTRLPFDGLLVGAGAILFITARGMAIYYATGTS